MNNMLLIQTLKKGFVIFCYFPISVLLPFYCNIRADFFDNRGWKTMERHSFFSSFKEEGRVFILLCKTVNKSGIRAGSSTGVNTTKDPD